MEINEIPEDIRENFIIKNLDIQVDTIELMIIQDIYLNDESTKIKLNTDLTETILNEIKKKIETKQPVLINIKGGVRSGKSAVGFRVGDVIQNCYNKNYADIEDIKAGNKKKVFENVNKIICGTQSEYRLRLANANFGDYYQIDENAFSNSGEGSSLEILQLRDLNNIIAKKNIHTCCITPQKFMANNSDIGLSYYGRDNKNWISRFLVYSVKTLRPVLLGYMDFNINTNFLKYGCLVYKFTGGCTNPEKLTLTQIPVSAVNSSFCIPKNINSDDLIQDGKSCPFYNVCCHPYCGYEHKKDSWIEKEMKGGMSERVRERFETSIRLLQYIADYEENPKTGTFLLRYRVKNGKDLKNHLRLFIPKVTSTKYTISEFEEILDILKSFASNTEFLIASVRELNDDNLIKEIGKINGGKELIKLLEKNP